MVVQFANKQDKVAVFKARGKLATTRIGLDDDLTHLQQQRKNAAWSDFKDFRSKGIKTVACREAICKEGRAVC